MPTDVSSLIASRSGGHHRNEDTFQVGSHSACPARWVVGSRNSLGSLVAVGAFSLLSSTVWSLQGSALWILPGKWVGYKTAHRLSDWD